MLILQLLTSHGQLQGRCMIAILTDIPHSKTFGLGRKRVPQIMPHYRTCVMYLGKVNKLTVMLAAFMQAESCRDNLTYRKIMLANVHTN